MQAPEVETQPTPASKLTLNTPDPMSMVMNIIDELEATRTVRGLERPVWRPEVMPVPPAIFHSFKNPRTLPEAERRLWSLHRDRVTMIEGRNASRLSGLLWAVSILRASPERLIATEAERRIVSFIHARYPGLAQVLRGERLPDESDALRAIVSRATRDYVALPKAWR